MIPIYSRTLDPAQVDEQIMLTAFTSEAGKNGTTFLQRKRQGPNRGFLRVLFPRFWLKVTPLEPGAARYDLKPDGLATFFFLVFIATGLIFVFQPDAAEDTPAWAPFAFAAWFAALAIRAVVHARRTLELATARI